MGEAPGPELCIGGREIGEPRCSPDGRFVAFTTSWGGRSAISVVPTGGGPERMITTTPDPRPGRGGCFSWCPDGGAVVYVARDGDLWHQPFPGGRARRLTTLTPDRGAQVPQVSADGRFVAYVVDLAELWVSRIDGEGPASRIAPTSDFVTDPSWAPDGRLAWHEWSVPAMAWDESRVVVVHPGEPRATVYGRDGAQAQQPRFGRDGRLWSLRDDTGWLNVWRDETVFLPEPFEHGRPTWGPGQRSFAVSPAGDRVAVARNERGFGRLVIAGPEPGAAMELGRGVHTELDWVGSVVVAIRSGAVTPPQLVAYDLGSGRRSVLVSGASTGWDAVELREPEAVTWSGSDGEELHGRLYPGGTDAKGLLCWIHGGPTDQWPVGFLPRVAYWAARGWNVFVPDFRGSTGHGRAYQQAMRHGWGELDVADVISGLRHAHRRGWGRPDRTVVIGGSAGGFTALHVMARTPELVAAGVVSYPVSDLRELDATTHRFEAHYNATLVGPRPETEARYIERSPVEFAARIAGPLLVLHGDADPVVGVGQSERLVQAITEAGGRAELHVYEGEGHGFRVPEHQLDEYRRITEFIDRLG